MADEIYGLSEADVSLLREMARAFRAGELGRPLAKPTRRPLRQEECIFGTLDGAIAATTAFTGPLKSGTMSVYSFTSTGGTSDTGLSETVYNAAKTQCITNVWTVAKRISRATRYIVIYQACSTT